MTAQQVKKWFESPLIVALVTFALGFGVNFSMNAFIYANKVDLLTQKVADLSVQISQLTDKTEKKNERIEVNSNRITALEVKVFGNSKDPEK